MLALLMVYYCLLLWSLLGCYGQVLQPQEPQLQHHKNHHTATFQPRHNHELPIHLQQRSPILSGHVHHHHYQQQQQQHQRVDQSQSQESLSVQASSASSLLVTTSSPNTTSSFSASTVPITLPPFTASSSSSATSPSSSSSSTTIPTDGSSFTTLSAKVIDALYSRKPYVSPIFRSVAGVYDDSLPKTHQHHRTTHHTFHHDNRTKIFARQGRYFNQTSNAYYHYQEKLMRQEGHHEKNHQELSPTEYHQTLSKTIFMTTISFVSKEDTHHYKLYLKNFLCFMKAHHIKLLVYIVHPNMDEIAQDVKELEMMGAIIIQYPTELFFTLLKEKISPMKTGRHHADYKATYPSFKSHGALVMLVPILEVLAYEHHVIFMDVDIGLVMDPVPYLLHNEVDIVMSQETRKCQEFYSTSYPNYFYFHTLEPNSGIMFVRSNKRNMATFNHWLHLIIDENVVNDQKVFDRQKLHLHYVHNCFHSSGVTLNEHDPFWSRSGMNAYTGASMPTFCFLNEILFQNGLIGINCPTKRAFHDDWLFEMSKYGVDIGDGRRYPVAVHANYCNGKTKELKHRGLWLLHQEHDNDLNSTTCKPYDRSKTYYSSIDWHKDVDAILQHRQETYESVLKRNGTVVVKAMSSPAVYFVDRHLKRHLIANKTVFVDHFGENWGIVTTIPFEVMANFTLGDPLDELSSVDSEHKIGT